MDFEEILRRWENTPEGKKAVEGNRFSRILEEKDAGLTASNKPKNKKGVRHLKGKKAKMVLDLHGFSELEAEKELSSFIAKALDRNTYKVEIVHGKGLHSVDNKGVLKEMVYEHLKSSPQVRAYGAIINADGLSGSVWVVLKR
jgi:DNA-nicking Smr family endonuclease